MSKLAVVTHPIYLKHDTGAYHPEKPQRLSAIHSHLENTGFIKKIELVEPSPAELSLIEEVHQPTYVQNVSAAILNGQKILDQGDTVVSEKSLDAAIYAVGAVKTGLDLLKSGVFDKIFCSIRPPGHHAEYDYAMGFCIFNNIAIAAHYAQKIGIAEKVLIVDWDVHHGNGTQHIFEKDDTVFYYSIHQFPFYPGTGASNETGKENGSNYTLNRPLNGGCADTEYLDAFEKDLAEIEKKFMPDIVMISAGFDAHKDDPLAGMQVTEYGYAQMTELLTKFAWKHGNGKILSVLEGGYNLDALSKSVEAHLDVLLKH